MGVKISVAVLAVLTWLSTTSAGLSDTGPQTFHSRYLNDNIALHQQYRKVLMYLTPSQIRTLQQTEEQSRFIPSSTTSAPETLNEEEQENYFNPNENQQNQESNNQAQYPYSSLNPNDGDDKNLDADQPKNYSTDIPVAESSYEYKDKNSNIYNQFRTVLSPGQDEKYVAPKLKNSFDQYGKEIKTTKQKENNNLQTQSSTISPEIIKHLQKILQQTSNYKNTQNAYNVQESDSLIESSKINNKQAYNGFKQNTSDFKTLSTLERSKSNQVRNTYSNGRPSFIPKSKVQEQRRLIPSSSTLAPETNENNRTNYLNSNKTQQNQQSNDQAQYSRLRETYDGDKKNIDDDKQEEYLTDVPVAESSYEYKDKNSYIYNQFKTVLSPEQDKKYAAPKPRNAFDRFEKEKNKTQNKEFTNPQTQTLTISPEILEQLLQQENTRNAYEVQESDSSNESVDMNSKQEFKQSENDNSSSIEQFDDDQARNIYSNERPSLLPNSKVQVSLSEEPDLPIRQQEPKRLKNKLTLEEVLYHWIPDNVKTTMINDTQSQTQNTESNKTQNVPSLNEENLSTESKKELDTVRLMNLKSQEMAEEVSELPPSTIRKEINNHKNTRFERINNRPVSIPVWWPVSTVTEDSQDNVKPLGLSTSLVHPEKKVIDKKVTEDLQKHFSAILKQNPAEHYKSFHRDIPVAESNDSANRASVKKEKKITIINHVWTE